jgi:hypothetical protein
MLLGGCMMQNQSAPAENGPSSFGFALTMTAVPDRLPRFTLPSETPAVNRILARRRHGRK